jgi:hypothetical protein
MRNYASRAKIGGFGSFKGKTTVLWVKLGGMGS